ncbi:hypothetical protein SLEP1_g7660 [Rubroshorea leprosula]|uniref:Uncharacterized protein n=1 Tax=Rubroshorea leprosula TaxID=152421 RepID=A0AAV5HZ65_9ROSI|nr:hypothetical protein SLEP1_g7660 [Rubroshorea leprosula]
MAIQGYQLFLLLAFLGSAAQIGGKIVTDTLFRTSFLDGFIFGAASSACQYEGAANERGKGPKIWETFTHQYPGLVICFSIYTWGFSLEIIQVSY